MSRLYAKWQAYGVIELPDGIGTDPDVITAGDYVNEEVLTADGRFSADMIQVTVEDEEGNEVQQV